MNSQVKYDRRVITSSIFEVHFWTTNVESKLEPKRGLEENNVMLHVTVGSLVASNLRFAHDPLDKRVEIALVMYSCII